MKSRTGFAAVALALALGAGSTTGAGPADDAALAKAPAAVQAAAKKALGEKAMAEFGKESVGGRVVYEVGFKVGAVDHAYIISDAGVLVQEEADVEVAQLPAAVAATVTKAQPEGKVAEAAMGTAGERHFYEVDVKVGKETHAIKVTPDGRLIADEVVKTLPADGEAAGDAKPASKDGGK